MGKQNRIVISGVKTWEDGQRGVVVNKASLFSKEQLPDEYLSGYPYCYKEEGRVRIQLSKSANASLPLGKFVPYETFEFLYERIQACGDRLHRVMRQKGAPPTENETFKLVY
jgi:hypothetical protein